MKYKLMKGIIAVVFLCGLGLFCYPYLVKWGAKEKSKQVIQNFEERNEEEKEETDSAVPFEELYQELLSYNRQLVTNGQENLKDPFSYETSSFELRQYGFSDNVIGTLWIPRLGLELPIYLGANMENMEIGVGLLGQTSMPLGGESTNVVIAGHRGYKGIPMFRDIQAIQIGDKIQITTPWETLIYRVCELKIVPKDETDVIYIQDGRDLVTLLTCHPYTKNDQRYIVIAQRSEEESSGKEEDKREAKETKSEALQEVELISENGSTSIVKVSPKAITPVQKEGTLESGAKYSGAQIWLENWGPVIGLSVVILVGIILRGIIKKKSQSQDTKK